MIVPAWVWPVLVAPLIGSFLSVVVKRLPEGRSFVFGRSSCDVCDHALGAADLVPLLSFCASRGRCRYCGAGLDRLDPAIEIAATFIAIWAVSLADGWSAWATCALGWTLLGLAIIDARDGLLPDALTLPLIVLGFVVTGISDPSQLIDSAIGAAAGYFLVVALRWLYRRWRKREGMGLGDAKLLAAAGSWVGWLGLPSVVLIASLLGIAGAFIVAWRGRALTADLSIAFGPALCAALWLVWLYGTVD